MNRYIKYSRCYRLAITCLVVALAAVVWAVVALTVFASPAATMSLFFIPTVFVAALMMSMKFWFEGKDRQFWYRLDKTEERSWN